MENKEYKGYTLFMDVEDKALRTRNRAVVMANIAEFNTKAQKITAKGVAMLTGYFDLVPKEDRKEVYEKFGECMKERGYAL